MATVNMTAESRTGTGKGVARKIRKSGLIPAVIYRGGNTPTHITIDAVSLEMQFQRIGNPNTLIQIEVDGTTSTCLAREVQRHPVSDAIRHMDFYEVRPDDLVTVTVPIEAVGRAEGTRMGGTLRVMARRMTVICKPADIPATVPVDVEPLQIGEFIRASKVPAPANTKLVFEQDFNVVTVNGKIGVEEITED